MLGSLLDTSGGSVEGLLPQSSLVGLKFAGGLHPLRVLGAETALLPGTTLAQMERELIRRTLEHTGGNRTHSAQLLGIGVRPHSYAGGGNGRPRPFSMARLVVGSEGTLVTILEAKVRLMNRPRATALEHRLGRMGGYCDCEIFMNAYTPHHDLWVRPPPTL